MASAVKLALLSLLTAIVAFLLVRMVVKGATAGGVTRRGEPMAYWSIIVAQTALLGFLLHALLSERL